MPPTLGHAAGDEGAPNPAVATLRTIADRTGVSVALVSAVINDSPHVRMSESTRARVVEEIRRSDYVPNQAARSLRLRRSKTLGVVLPALHNPIFRPALDGMYAQAEKHGYVIVLAEAQQLASGSGLMDRVVAHGGMDGLLVRTTARLRDTTLSRLLKAGTPMVALEKHPEINSVRIDEGAGVALATSHLVHHGHRRVGFFGGDADYVGTQLRAGAFRRTMRAAGLDVEAATVHFGPQEPVSAYPAARRFLAQQPELTGLVCNNVSTAFGVSAAAADLGIGIPEDLSLVAFHDVPEAGIARPALTTVRMPMRELGEAGMSTLLAVIAGDDVPQAAQIDVAPELVERGSVARPRIRR